MPSDQWQEKKQSVIRKLQNAKTVNGWFEGMLICPNKNCITVQPREPANPRFRFVRIEPPTLQCYYCGRYIDQDSVMMQNP